ncbi:LytTR family DNA-binding domain-containing protein [Flavihumibacter rivuli]|uniref:LytR/AlgR family response regulator transcription factor n=1 Tax=Flavihumibacter rivuli TaxID=2838156 RepID=UPI001BDF6644|nr:LytTR family DNA-binding domain-containing protein [Flavihumibacter rivuli]ULQ57506.1 LytTR family DNA-binding domain-containing protein [Flavihumibacter rivuli]
MKLHSIILEDLDVAAKILAKYCDKSGLVDNKAIFSSIEPAIPFLAQNKVDVIFLDIEMPGENGFALLDQLPNRPHVILTTSHIEYAYSGFEYDVTDFLRKPFTYSRFLKAIEKIKDKEPEPADNALSHVYVKCDGKMIRLHNDEILFIESMGDYVKFITPGKKFISHNTLKALTGTVNPQVFVKVHRSYIINIKKVSSLQSNSIVIENNVIPISKANRPLIRKLIC